MKNIRIILNCKRCKGRGLSSGKRCADCEGTGYKVVDKEIYYQQLRMEQKTRKELQR